MEKTFNGIKAVSNDSKGDEFLSAMINVSRNHDEAEKAFEAFCRKEGIGGWAVADGHLEGDAYLVDERGYNTYFGAKNTRFTWFSEYNACKRKPEQGELFAFIDTCVPETDMDFAVKIYRVLNRISETYVGTFYKYELELFDTKWCRFSGANNCFEFFTPPPKKSLWSLFLKFIHIN